MSSIESMSLHSRDVTYNEVSKESELKVMKSIVSTQIQPESSICNQVTNNTRNQNESIIYNNTKSIDVHSDISPSIHSTMVRNTSTVTDKCESISKTPSRTSKKHSRSLSNENLGKKLNFPPLPSKRKDKSHSFHESNNELNNISSCALNGSHVVETRF